MATSAVTGTVGSTGTGSVDNTTGAMKSLGQDEFLKLLITQLENQDPMSPMDNEQFISQLAQFSSLQEMQKVGDGFGALNQNTATSRALAMIGREVDYADPNTGGAASGKVDSVSFTDGTPQLNIGTKSIDPSWVVTVY